MPPGWIMSAEQVEELNVHGLQYFPLQQFLESYDAQREQVGSDEQRQERTDSM